MAGKAGLPQSEILRLRENAAPDSRQKRPEDLRRSSPGRDGLLLRLKSSLREEDLLLKQKSSLAEDGPLLK